MTDKIDDGGPAFPAPIPPTYEVHADVDGTVTADDITSGMSLRQWYAGMALHGATANSDLILSSERIAKETGFVQEKLIAELCFAHADAMIERGKK